LPTPPEGKFFSWLADKRSSMPICSMLHRNSTFASVWGTGWVCRRPIYPFISNVRPTRLYGLHASACRPKMNERELKMSKKILAIAITLLMILSAVSVITPSVKADTPGGVTVFLRPGVEDPYHPGWSQTLGTLWDNPEEVINKHLEYAILASTEDSPSIGDLQFDITVDSSFQGAVAIAIPPDFVFLKPDGTPAATSSEKRFNVWTDITSDRGYVYVSTLPLGNAFAPGWTYVRVGNFRWSTDDDPLWYDGTMWDPGTYHIRLFNLKAPTTAGVYHFKMGMGTHSAVSAAYAFDPRDWPIMIVKSELNTAYVTGDVGLCAELTCTFTNTDRYGKVWLEGTTPEGRTVSAVYYMAPEDTATTGWSYTYWLFGVAPGTYTLYASAGGVDGGIGGGGYPKGEAPRFDVLAGQSKHLDTVFLGLGPSVDVTVYAKHGRGELPWGSLWQPPYGTNDPTNVDLSRPRPISLDLHDTDGNWVMWTGGLTDPLATSYTVQFSGAIQETGMAPARLKKTINGFTSGAEYEVKAWVTGYVMTEDDAWQRKFTVSGSTSVGMDLRRSNWFAIRPHMQWDLPNTPTTLVLAAEQDGVEKGVTSLIVEPNGDLGFWDPGCGYFWYSTCATYGPQVNPNTGLNYNINTDSIILEGWSNRYMYTAYEDDPAWKDYGLQPGTYEIKMYMADMGDQTGAWWGTPGVEGAGWYTITTDHTGTIALCNSPSEISFWVTRNKLTLKLRSVDWQTPAHPKPWTFPGAEIGLDILDADDNVVESLSNDMWGVVQDDGTIGSTYALSDDDLVNPPFPGEDTQLTVVFTGNDYQHWGFGPDSGLPINYIGLYPTHLEPGQYKFSVNTYGYVERRNFPHDLTLGGNADIQVDLMQGAQIRVLMDFNKEYDYIAFNGWVRVEVFNEADELVGASVYGMADVNPLAPSNYAPWDPTLDWKKINTQPAEGAGSDAGYGQRAYMSNYFWGVPGTVFQNYIALDPIDAQRLIVPADPFGSNTAAFDVFGFYNYFGGKSSRNDGLWANGYDTTDGAMQTNTGLRGSPDGQGITGGGLYKVKVWAFDPLGPDGLTWDPNDLTTLRDDWQSYYMGSDIAGVEVPWGGVTTVVVHMQQYGRLSGFVAWTDMYGNVKNMPWVKISSACSPEEAFMYTTPGLADDDYFVWLSAGTCDISAQVTVAPQVFEAPGAPYTVSISPGFNTMLDVGLQQTGVPVPEFPVAPLVALSALAASLYVLRRRRE